jgi:hypothetical protein
MNAIVPVRSGQLRRAAAGVPEILLRAGGNAVFAAEEFFKATINNAHTKRAYGRSLSRFLAWCEEKGVDGGAQCGMLSSGFRFEPAHRKVRLHVRESPSDV